jgi:hypothetical protein
VAFPPVPPISPPHNLYSHPEELSLVCEENSGEGEIKGTRNKFGII